MGKNNNNTISWKMMLGALIKFIPRLPIFFCTLVKLAWAKKHHRGSTGWFLQQAARRYPKRIFLKTHEGNFTYEEFNSWVNQLAHALATYGIKDGDCVALLFNNSATQLAWAFAINKLGAIAGMLNSKQRQEALAHSIKVLQPKLLISQSAYAEDVAILNLDLQCALDSRMEWNQLSAAAQACFSTDLTPLIKPEHQHNPSQTETITLAQHCFYVLTSGTTGLPKAAAMTHFRWYKAGIGFGHMALRLKQQDTLYNTLPLYHNTALSIALSAVVMSGSSLALSERFSTSGFWQDIKDFQASVFVYVGEMCRYLLNQPPHASDNQHGIRAIIGNGIRAEIWDEFQQRFDIRHICELYGASEGNVGFVNAFNLKRTVGFSPMTYAVVAFDFEREIPVQDDLGYLQPVAKGDVGLLLTKVSSKAPFDGYTNNPQANAEKLLADVFKPGDCWFNTGDLVRHQGFRHIAFVDRTGETFRWKSENVATTEVEAQVARVTDIIEAVAYGVKVPHAEGKAGMVSLVLAQGREFNPQEFFQTIRKHLPEYALPRFIRLRQHHELTTTFKVMKTQLKKDSFSLAKVTDPLYVLVDLKHGYQPLSTQLYEAIHQGLIQLK